MGLKSVLVLTVIIAVTQCQDTTTQRCGNDGCGYEEIMVNNRQILQEIEKLQNKVENLQTKVDNISKASECTNCEQNNLKCSRESNPPYNQTWRDCADVYKAGQRSSGVYKVKPTYLTYPVNVYCDVSNGAGWTVFQRRQDGSVSFNRTWQEYKQGFGDLNGEFWLGNDILAAMTVSDPQGYRLHIDMMGIDWKTAYAEYSNFQIDSESQQYKLNINTGSFRGTTNDGGAGLSYNNGKKFSTFDKDNDSRSISNCAWCCGGWWYFNCSLVQLNGQYSGSFFWYTLFGGTILQKSEMKFRPMN